MEPKRTTPEFMPQNQPSSPEFNPNQGQTPEVPAPFGERSGERGAERPQQVVQPAPTQPVPITLPTPVPQQSDQPAVVPADDMPSVAADEDLIEKDWVDKAKKIISETKDDPRRREQEVNKLQSDYLRKRYGKELGTPAT